jgi:hypothetical protein
MLELLQPLAARHVPGGLASLSARQAARLAARLAPQARQQLEQDLAAYCGLCARWVLRAVRAGLRGCQGVGLVRLWGDGHSARNTAGSCCLAQTS